MTERWHGTDGGYTNHACRCADCTRAHAEYRQRYRHADPERLLKHAARQRDYRARKKDAEQA